MLSLSIDFYIRVFFRVYSSPIQVKRSFSQSGTVYVCGGCQNAISQPFGRVEENKKGTNVNYSYKNTAMPRELGNKCGQCGGTNHVCPPFHPVSFQFFILPEQAAG
jgi:tRNA (guanine26-N2/guanine27-N2)-dimethyltransferase